MGQTTRLSRFTQLRRAETSPGIRVGARARIENRIQSATSKNRRLAMQMARRPAVIAALNFRRGRGMQRNTIGSALPPSTARFTRTNSIRGSFRSSFRGRGTQRLGGRLSRSQSLQSLTGRGGGGALSGRIGVQGMTRGGIQQGMMRGGVTRGRGGSLRGRGPGRMFRAGSVGRFNGNRFDNNGLRRGIGNLRGRGAGSFRRAGGVRRGGIGRGRGRGRGINGRGGRGGGAEKPEIPKKEALDMELDQYMSASRVALDKEIDQYMNEPEEKWD